MDPLIGILITTHNRTKICCECIDSIFRNLKYDNILYVISDDRSNIEHINILKSKFQNFIYLKTNNDRYGLGASLNNGLKYIFKYTDIVLNIEDDWILEKELDLNYYVDVLQNDKNISAIRLGYVSGLCKYKQSKYNNLNILYGDKKDYYPLFTNQVMLRHKRIYDDIGYYKENVHSDITEKDMVLKYNNYTSNGNIKYQLLYPSQFKFGSLDDESLYFIHCGKSTVGHSYKIPERYIHLNI